MLCSGRTEMTDSHVGLLLSPPVDDCCCDFDSALVEFLTLVLMVTVGVKYSQMS
jgi:hypothetical protein